MIAKYWCNMPNYQQFIDHLFAKSTNAGIPLSGTFELTSRCNLDCRMCYIHKRENDPSALREELPAEEWIRIAGDAQRSGMLLLLLTGGEPLLRPDFAAIYTACRRLGLLVSVNTNGTLIDGETIELWKKYPPLRVNLTLYGASPASYRRLCGHSDACERAYRAVELLIEAGIRCKLNFSATPENIDDLPEIFAFSQKRELPLQVASYMFPPVRAGEWEQTDNEKCSKKCENCENTVRMDPETAGMIRFRYDSFRFDADTLAKRIRSMLAGAPIRDPDDECQELPTERIRCRAGSTTFWITCSGAMRPCGMMTTPSIPLCNDFPAAWREIRSEREKILLPARCTACPKKEICEFCPAACYAENGAYTVHPAYLCRKLEAYLNCGRTWLAKYDAGCSASTTDEGEITNEAQ